MQMTQLLKVIIEHVGKFGYFPIMELSLVNVENRVKCIEVLN